MILSSLDIFECINPCLIKADFRIHLIHSGQDAKSLQNIF